MMTLSLSEQAWDGLRKQARTANYIQTDIRARGIIRFMNELVKANPDKTNWQDTRPDWIKDADPDLFAERKWGTWDDGEYRHVHRFGDPPEDIVTAICVLVLDIGMVRNKMKGAPRRWSSASLMGQFWEAIGLEWLTPKNVPYLADHRTYGVKKQEWDW